MAIHPNEKQHTDTAFDMFALFLAIGMFVYGIHYAWNDPVKPSAGAQQYKTYLLPDGTIATCQEKGRAGYWGTGLVYLRGCKGRIQEYDGLSGVLVFREELP